MLAKVGVTKATRRERGKSSRYRRNRALRGCRRIDVILSPQATRAMAALNENGLTATRAVCEALQELAEKRGLVKKI